MKKRTNAFLLSILIPFSLLISGCISVNASIKVNSNGSGELSTSLGFSSQFIALITSKGVNPIKNLRQTLFKQIGRGVTFDERDEGGFEWLELNRPFSNVDELNDVANAQPFVENFILQRQRGFLKDQFIIDAQFVFDENSNPFADMMDENGTTSTFDSTAPLDLQVSMQLPGKILETNGNYDDTTQSILWKVNDADTLEIHARSESWNMMNIALAIALALVAIVLVALIIKILLRVRKRSKPLEEEVVSQRIAESIQAEEEEKISALPKEQTVVIPPSKILAMIGARELLEQVNTHVLNNRGNISSGKGAIRLVWRDQKDEAVTRGLMITVRDAQTILINGVPFPATRDAARQGLISCLKGMTKQ